MASLRKPRLGGGRKSLALEMRGGKLKDLAISAINEANPTVESLSSLFVSTLKGKTSATYSPSLSEDKSEIATWKSSILSERLLPGISDLGPSEKSELPAGVSSKVLSVLKEARSGNARKTPCRGNSGCFLNCCELILSVSTKRYLYYFNLKVLRRRNLLLMWSSTSPQRYKVKNGFSNFVRLN